MENQNKKHRSGVFLIGVERQRQIEEEGFSVENDDKYANGELGSAGVCYSALEFYRNADADEYEDKKEHGFFPWPWHLSWWKPSDDPVKNLVKAGALIAAEIDRLNRLKAKQAEGGEG